LTDCGLLSAVPAFRLSGVIPKCIAQSIHGPPGPVWLTRGPPSLT
jgi:hypothetical protein